MSDSSDEEVLVKTAPTQPSKSRVKKKKEQNENVKNGAKNDEESDSGEDVGKEVEEDTKSFAELGVTEILVEACERLGWKEPSKIQRLSLPAALSGRDIIGLAETGSGKTGAFALPILQSLLEHPQKLFSLILTPTRELAFQIAKQFEDLGTRIGLLVAVIVGGVDMTTQAIALAKLPHIIVATPGRLVDHLENTKGFSLRALKFLVMDEADRILNMDFEVDLDKILKVIPRERRTYLFSATMTKKVQKLERASLRDPVRVEVNSRYKTVDTLVQQYIFVPQKYKESYLVYLLNELAGKTTGIDRPKLAIIFVATCLSVDTIARMLRQLGMAAVSLHGQMTQQKRLGALNAFTTGSRNILVCTDVASRGLDIPEVNYVLNYDVPGQAKDYVHRVGRTARAGRSGLAITFVTQYEVAEYQRIEAHIGKKLTDYPCVADDVMHLVERTNEAMKAAREELKEIEERKKRGKRTYDDSDTEEKAGGRFKKRLKNQNQKGGPKIKDKLAKR
ncbi:unnamed protein product, partial [Mesorhabditis belari]|uniref:RNA helicase n=1 Tax=Mesorhabditis belari TaxID=2138241 RepID=A0AAF3FT08_9BILA